MDEKSPIKRFLKGFLDFNKSPAEPLKIEPPQPPLTETVSPPSPAPAIRKALKPKSEAYLNRKKGRTSHGDKMGHLRLMIDYLLSHGEVAPGVMAKDLNLPKSTLIYNLNRLLATSNKVRKTTRRYHSVPIDYVLNKLAGGKHLERVGGGKYVSYRLVEKPFVPEKPSESPD